MSVVDLEELDDDYETTRRRISMKRISMKRISMKMIIENTENTWLTVMANGQPFHVVVGFLVSGKTTWQK